MFKHEKTNDDKECDLESSDSESDDEDDKNDSQSVSEMIPILEKFKEAVEKFDILPQKCSLRYKRCDFEAIMHMKAKHKH